ncbi:hypothetical protein [Nonomuraea terrae]|uniref:hypothetical protein n=1 Tax=Nonomuraea terrae TaxID=2530383 RepID=UPI001404B163|nr:hypothetical protein [Nonomuraea terrae]
MARYTEDDLRTALEERSSRERWLLPDVGEIARLGGGAAAAGGRPRPSRRPRVR